MATKTDEMLDQLFMSIVADFQSQLDGPFHRGGASGLSFEPVREPDGDQVCGFRVVTGGLDWQAQLSTIRTCDVDGVLQRRSSAEGEREGQEPIRYRLWMNVETLEGLHKLARDYVKQTESGRDWTGRVSGEQELYRTFVDKAARDYQQAEETACLPQSRA